MIRVLNEARSVTFYDKAFGLKVDARLDFEAFTLLYLRNPEADFEVELTVNKGRTEPYNLGDGYGHLAFVVDDLEAEHARMTEAGPPPRRQARACHRGAGHGPRAVVVEALEAAPARMTEAGLSPRKLVSFAPDGGEPIA